MSRYHPTLAASTDPSTRRSIGCASTSSKSCNWSKNSTKCCLQLIATSMKPFRFSWIPLWQRERSTDWNSNLWRNKLKGWKDSWVDAVPNFNKPGDRNRSKRPYSRLSFRASSTKCRRAEASIPDWLWYFISWSSLANDDWRPIIRADAIEGLDSKTDAFQFIIIQFPSMISIGGG